MNNLAYILGNQRKQLKSSLKQTKEKKLRQSNIHELKTGKKKTKIKEIKTCSLKSPIQLITG